MSYTKITESEEAVMMREGEGSRAAGEKEKKRGKKNEGEKEG